VAGVQLRLKVQKMKWRLIHRIFFEELHKGDLSGCLHFLFEDLFLTFQDIIHLPTHLGTSHAVGIVLITNNSLRMTEHEPLTQDDGA